MGIIVGFGGVSWEQAPTAAVIEVINNASSVTCQLFKLLKMVTNSLTQIFKKIPIQELDTFYDGSVPFFVYRVLIADVVQQEETEQPQ